MAAQDACAQCVEGTKPNGFRRAADEVRDPFAHLARSLVGEGDGEHLIGTRLARAQQMSQPSSEHARLAGASPSKHQHRAIQRLNGLSLGRVQLRQIGDGCRLRNPGFLRFFNVERIAHDRLPLYSTRAMSRG